MPICVLLLAAMADPNSSAERERLQGAWEISEVVWAGERYAGEYVSGNKAVVKDGKIEFSPPPPPGGFVPKKKKQGVGLMGVFSFELDPSSSPKAIDLSRQDDGKSTKGLGIYRIEGDVLTICVAEDRRPNAFESPKDSTAVLIIMKRKKK